MGTMANINNTRIAKEIRKEINDNLNGRRDGVFAVATEGAIRFRIIAVRAKSSWIEAKCLNSGKWFRIAGIVR